MGRADGAGAEDNFAALDGERFSAALDPCADGTPHPIRSIGEQYPLHVAIGADGQVEPVPGLVEVAQGGAHAHPAGVVEGSGPDAGGVGVVMVRTVGETGLPAGGVERRLGRVPGLGLEAVTHDGAFGAVEVVGEV